MADGFVEAISDHLECGICSCRFDNAKYLDCLHTFCEGCINRLLDQTNQGWHGHTVCVRCPICRRVTRFHAGKAETLKPNLIVNRIIEEFEHHDYIGHKEDLCADHGVERKFFCEKCGVIICSECALCKHCGHTFLIKNIEDATRSKVDEIVKLMSEATLWLKSHKEFSSECEKKRAEGNKRLDDIKEAIETSYITCIESITNKIEVKKETLMVEVASRREGFDQALNDVLVPLTEAISRVSNDIKIAEDLLDNTDTKKLLLHYQDWARSILSSLDYVLPSDSTARPQLTVIESMCFHPSPVPIFDVPTLGVIRRHLTKPDDHRDQSDSISEPETDLQRPTRRLLLTVRSQLSGRIEMMTSSTNNSILVRYRDGQMEVLSPDGSNVKIEGEYISARDMAVLSDGRFVTLTDRSTVNIYNKEGQYQEVEFSTANMAKDDEIADAIATDVDDNIFLLYSGVASVMRFSPEGGESTAVIPITSNLKDVSKMDLTRNGKIMVVAAEEVLTFGSEGALCRRVPIRETDRVSCDQEGNLWMISHQDIQGTNRAFLEVYGEKGVRIADTYLPNDDETPGFKPWGIAASTTYFAAHISPNEVAWYFKHEVGTKRINISCDPCRLS